MAQSLSAMMDHRVNFYALGAYWMRHTLCGIIFGLTHRVQPVNFIIFCLIVGDWWNRSFPLYKNNIEISLNLCAVGICQHFDPWCGCVLVYWFHHFLICINVFMKRKKVWKFVEKMFKSKSHTFVCPCQKVCRVSGANSQLFVIMYDGTTQQQWQFLGCSCDHSHGSVWGTNMMHHTLVSDCMH